MNNRKDINENEFSEITIIMNGYYKISKVAFKFFLNIL